jgi:hypothetical protein
MGYDREQMKKELLERTKTNYDNKDSGSSNRHFDPDADIPFWKPSPTTTKGKPHIIDILPFQAGPHFPTKDKNAIKEGRWTYVLNVWVHKKVGPGKATVVCPAKNYGNRCPICEEIEQLERDGVERDDIAFIAKRQCTYNVLVMDDVESESKGVQVWDVSYAYSEKAILEIARSARDGGYIPFSDIEKETGRSIAFDVANDKYKKITGHRFELRDYDIPEDLLEDCFPLDTLLVIHTYDELYTILWGEEGKPQRAAKAAEAEPAAAPRRTLLRGGGSGGQAPETAPETTQTSRSPLRREAPKSNENQCPIGAQFGDDNGQFGECESCEVFQQCAETADKKQYEQAKNNKEQEKAEPAAPPTNPGGRRLLGRRGTN